jgi:hypothetical protein
LHGVDQRSWDRGAEFRCFYEWAIYQTRHGAFFKVVVQHDGSTWDLKPLNDDEAMGLLQRKGKSELVEQYFGPFPEGGAAERRLTVRLPANLVKRIEAAAEMRNQALNAYIMRCLEQSVAADGHPAGRD